MTIIEGSPEELAEYQARSGGDIEKLTAEAYEEAMTIRSHIFRKARTPVTGGLVDSYVTRMRILGGIVPVRGTSHQHEDGYGPNVLLYAEGPRSLGAAADAHPEKGTVDFRLSPDDVGDIDDPAMKVYPNRKLSLLPVSCRLASPEDVELAVSLTQRALDKVRRERGERAAAH
jgi:hypothetical protein